MEGEVEEQRPDAIDRYVGQRLRARRLLLGMMPTELAAALAVTPQKLESYESGTGCLHAQELDLAARALHVSTTYFFEGLQDQEATEKDRALDALLEEPETIELIRAFWKIPYPGIKRQFLDLVRSVVEHQPKASREDPPGRP